MVDFRSNTFRMSNFVNVNGQLRFELTDEEVMQVVSILNGIVGQRGQTARSIKEGLVWADDEKNEKAEKPKASKGFKDLGEPVEIIGTCTIYPDRMMRHYEAEKVGRKFITDGEKAAIKLKAKDEFGAKWDKDNRALVFDTDEHFEAFKKYQREYVAAHPYTEK